MSFLGNLFNQINPFDNGKTFSNPKGQPQPLPPQPQRPAPPQQPRVNLPQFLAAMQVHSQQSQPQFQQRPPTPQVPHPSFLSQLGNIPRDIGGAIAATNRNVINPVGDSFLHALDVANAGRQGLQGLAQSGVAAAFHNPVAEQNAINKTNAAINYSLNASRGVYTPQEAHSTNPMVAVVKPVTRNVVNYAPYALGGMGAAEASLAPTLGGKALGVGINTGMNYGVNTLLNAANQTVSGQPVNFRQAAKQAIVPTLAGTALGVAPMALDALGNNLAAHPLGEVGAIGKNVNEPNLNKGAFGAADRANLDKQLTADQATKLPSPVKSSDFPMKTATGKSTEPLQTNPMAPVKLPEVKNGTEAIRVGESLSQNFTQRAKLVANAQDKLLGKSLQNRDAFYTAVERPAQTADIAKTFGKNSQAFTDLVQQHRDLTNLEHASQMGAGNPRPYFGGESGYIHHDVALGSPADQAAYNALLTHTARGSTALERTNPTLADLRANKLDITPKSAGDATRLWAARQGTIMRDAALQDRLKTLDPNLQVVQAPGENPRFVSANKQLNKELRGVQPFTAPAALKAANAVNTGIKQMALFGGGFHDFKTTIRETTQELASLRNPLSRLAEGNKQLVSNAAHDAWNQTQIKEGYGPAFADAGVAKTNIGQDLHGGLVGIGKDLSKGSIEKLNPYMTRLFGNKLDYFKKQFVIDELNKKGITGGNYDPQNPAHRAIAQQAGDGAQNWMGGLNQRVIGKHPIVQQALKWLTLAPDFTEGKIRAVGNALNPLDIGKAVHGKLAMNEGFKGLSGNIARRQVLSEAVGVAMLAEAGSKGLTGQFINPVNAVLNPSVKTNMKDKKGRPLAISLPGSTAADIYRMATDPGHFASSHLGAGAGTLIAAKTGKDYYGNDLVDPFKNPAPSFKDNLLAALKSKGTIPGMQFGKTVSGQQSALTGVINTLGGRVGLDKTTPEYQATQAFFNNQAKFVSSLNTNDKTLFNAVNPVKKDASGQPVYDATLFTKAGIAAQLASNPAFTAKYQTYQQSQPSHDPLWDLPQPQLQAVLMNRAGRLLPAQTYTKSGISLQEATGTANAPWYQALLAKQKTFYAGLPKGTSTSTPIDYGPQASPYVSTQLNAKNYKDPQVIKYLNDRATYANQQRQQVGLAPIAPSGQINQPGQLDNPIKIAVTPKGSSYGTGAPKVKTAKTSKVATIRTSTSVRGSGTTRTRTAALPKAPTPKLPKVVRVKAGKVYKAPKLPKVSFGRLPGVSRVKRIKVASL